MRVNNKRGLALIVAICLIISIVPSKIILAENNSEKNVINLVIDGLSDKMYEEIKSRGVDTPNIDLLISNGARLREVETVIPSYGGSQATALTGADTDTNRFLYRYYDRESNTCINDTKKTFNMEAQTIFEKFIEDNNGAKVLATGWHLGDKSIDGRGVFKEGNENYKLKEYERGDKLISVESVTKDIIEAINTNDTPKLIMAYSNDIKMAGWGGTDSLINNKLDETIRLIDKNVGEIVNALKDTGKYKNTTIILNSLSNVYTIGSKITTGSLASKITSATGVKAVESGGGNIESDVKVVIIKQYIMAYAQLYFTNNATEEDKEKVLSYLKDKTNDIGENIEDIYSYEELGISRDYCDYLINPISGKSFSAAGSGTFRTDNLDYREVFCVVSGEDIENGSGVKGSLSIKDIAATICSILGVNPPNNNEGKAWVFEQVSEAPIITVIYPKDNMTVYKDVITLTGSTNMEAIVKVNGVEVNVSDNKFSADVTLSEGKNDIVITATNSDGKSSTKVVTVRYMIKPEIPDGNIAVYINWDGFANYYIDLAEKEGKIPTLSNIKNNEGVYFSNAKTGIPSITNPMQAAIASGTTSKYTGNSYRYFDKEKNVIVQETPSRKNESETMAESVVRQGLNAISINQFAFEDRGTVIGDELNPYVNSDIGENGCSDAIARFDTAIELVKNLRAGDIKLDAVPRFIALYMDDLDGIGHNEVETYGSKLAKTEDERIKNVVDRLELMDKKLGEFIEACKEAGIYEKMSFVLTADHGMANFGLQNSTNDDSYKSKLEDLINTIEGLGDGYECEFLHPSQIQSPSEGTDIAIVTVGLQAQISYVNEFDSSVIEDKNKKILDALKEKGYIGEIMYPEEMEERGVKSGFADLIISPKTPYHFHSSIVSSFTARGQHDSLEDRAQNIAAFMWGNGIKKGYECTDIIYNTDFMPTMSKLLNVNAPLDSTGNILYEALEEEVVEDKYIEKIEAECATLNGSASKYFDTNASDELAVTGLNSEGSYIEFINVPKSTKMLVNYSAGNNGKLVMYKNEKVVRNIYFPETNSESSYEEKVINIDLEKGDTVKFVFESSNGSAKINIDKIDFYSDKLPENEEIKTGNPFTIVMSPNGDTTRSMGFAWYTDENVKGTKVELIEDDGQEVDFSDSIVFTGICETVGTKLNGDSKVYESHKAISDKLEPGTKYFYRVGDGVTWSEAGSFTTSDEGEFSFLYLTDSQGKNEGDYEVWARTLDKALTQFPESKFMVMAGDMVDAGLNVPNNEQEWIYFFEKARKSLLNLPMAPVMGNHEGRNNTGFANHFNLPIRKDIKATPLNSVYSFDYNDVHFAMLNTEMADSKEMFEPQIEWLKRDMIATDKKWKIIVLHKPLYSTSSHIKDKDIVEVIKPMLGPVIDELGIDLVLQGHDHIYARTVQIYNGEKTDDIVTDGKVKNPEGTMYLISNTSGFKYYDQHPDANFELFEKTEQPKDQSYTGITINNKELKIESYLLNNSEVYDSYKIERTDIAPQAVEDFIVMKTDNGKIKLKWDQANDINEYVIYELDNKINNNWSIRVNSDENKDYNELVLDMDYSDEYKFAIKSVVERSYSHYTEAITEEVMNLIKDIDNLPEEVNLGDKALVNSLMERYNNLSDKDKALVRNYKKLEDAAIKIKELEAEGGTDNEENNNEENNSENENNSGKPEVIDPEKDSNLENEMEKIPNTGSIISYVNILILGFVLIGLGYYVMKKKKEVS
ncbi:alkaline phosphatase family protein [Clostridium tertium]|uniref:alkaline phosphatase family protein n=1 Tax=Clostridium tertium TaxID=1559 RepID=UPI0035636195